MGNKHTKRSGEVTSSGSLTHYQDFYQTEDISFGRRSLHSIGSHQSVYSVSRPWSRISRRRWKESTLTLPYELSKTAWPVSQSEAFFLPEFPINPVSHEGNFQVLEEVAHGAFGTVYKVCEKETRKFYALKVLSKSKVVKENAIRQVKDEVHIQKVCGHFPFIVGCPYQWQNRTNLYIVSEFVDGGELYDLLKACCILPVVLVQLYVAQLALTLDFLHNAGIIYRDLKPENILLDPDGNLQLIDFGLSKWLSYGSKTSTVCGTLRYTAPEVFSMQPYGHAVDWWSLGVIACVMLTNKCPTPAITSESTPAKKPGTLPEDVTLDTASRDLLLRLLEIDPTKRLRSLRTLQTIAFFKNYDFNAVKDKKLRPNDLLRNYFPDYFEEKQDRRISYRNVTI